MNFDPQKLFIGLIDFFSILMPGALLAFLFKGLNTDDPFLHPIVLALNRDGSGQVFVFLFISYLLGHFLFLIGSFLDGWFYDRIRACTVAGQVKRIMKGQKLSRAIGRYVAITVFKKKPDNALNRVIKIKESYLNRIDASEALNAFQWSKLKLVKDSPEALAKVNRFEADSKFFRSFVPVLAGVCLISLILILWLFWLYPSSYIKHVQMDLLKILAISTVFLVLAFLRYMDQRFKAIQQAYWAIISLEAEKHPLLEDSHGKRGDKDSPTHAGGVVVRQQKDKKTTYLLVQSSKKDEHWVLPKGPIEAGVDEKACALQAVWEEAGVWATLIEKQPDPGKRYLKTEIDLGITPYKFNKKDVRVRFYLMRYLKKELFVEKRKVKWLNYKAAMDMATCIEAKKALAKAENELRKLSSKGEVNHDAEKRDLPHIEMQHDGQRGTPS